MRLWAVLLIGLAAAPAWAAGPAPTPAPPPAAAISAQDAQTALSVLQDDKRRAELITTLEAVARAAPAAAPGPATSGGAAVAAPAAAQAGAAPAAAATTLAPDSVGAKLASRFTVMLSAYARQFAGSLQSVNDVPRLVQWLRLQSENPYVQQAAAGAVERLGIVLAVALLVEYATRRLFRRPRAALLARSPHAHPDEHSDLSARPEAEAQRRRYERVLAGLRKVPFLLGRLVLDLLPIAAFLAATELLLGSPLGEMYYARMVSLQVAQSYVYARVILATGALLFSDETPRLRLLSVTDWAAEFLTRWLRRITVIAVTGLAVSDIGVLFGMDQVAEMAVRKLFALFGHLGLVIAVLQARRPLASRLRARRSARGLWVVVLERVADSWHLFAIFFLVALWLIWAVDIPNGYERLVGFTLTTVAVIGGARLCAILLLGGMERVRGMLAPGAAGRAGVYYPVARGVVSVALWVAASILLLETWGLPIVLWMTAGGLGGQVLQALSTIVIAIVLAITAWEWINASLDRHMTHLAGSAQLARAGRLRTLLPLLRTTLLGTIVLVVGMVVLSAVGVNIAPLLAGAGVLGIAIGFGSQKLVQDLITGLFLLLENAMQVGDVVTVSGLSGTVEALSIRTIRLRALDGAVHLIPFSAVTTVTNQTRDYSYALVDVAVGLNEEPVRIEQVLRELAAEMQSDGAWQSMVLDKLDVMGVEKLTDMAWILRVRMKTQPSSRWAVARELNRRIKVRFDSLAIESPFTSHRVLSRDAPPPASLGPAQAVPEAAQ